MRKHKYYLVYKTYNTVNGKYYIGCHRTNVLDDGYLGSGKLLKAAIRKYGIDKFKRRILKFCATKEEMFWWERKLVGKHLGRPKCYNLAEGGHGGWDHVNKDQATEEKRLTATRAFWLGRSHKQETKDKIGAANAQTVLGARNGHYGKCWISHDEAQLTMRVQRAEVEDYFNQGWRAGRVMRYQHVKDYLLELP